MKNKIKTIATAFALGAMMLWGDFALGQACNITCSADAGPNRTYQTCCACVTIGPTTAGRCGICNGNTCGNCTYSWAPSAGLSSTTVCNPCASPTATTTYTLTVDFTNADCCCSPQVTGTTCTPTNCTTIFTDQVLVTVSSQNSCCRMINPGVQKEMNTENYTLYPNPSAGIFSLDIGKENSNVSIFVYDMEGKNVWLKENVSDRMININISNLPKGSYFIQAKSGENVIFYKKAILQ